ncbi:Uncharacterised protein [Candidatus Bilamarchaeum dharawalense]|uniref:Methyltransferase type 11 domain-containing protein n=1 Tax=Candidatus Bilamarchaeum dharawalense TaxID=2885759 RepID=A0A5E4LS21_9ARCH|nr:Uncharacterised protein [Candidatus Bilamarchaeum dharawalense]
METPDSPWARNQDIRVHKPKIEPPNQAAIFLYDFLRSKNISFGRMIDIGGGNGRNAVYFAERGFEVHCVDQDSIPDLDLHGVTSHSHSINDFWHFEREYFDVALDVCCYSRLSDAERHNYKNELKRVLQDGGFYLLSIPEKDAEKLKKEFSDFRVDLTKTIENQIVFIFSR